MAQEIIGREPEIKEIEALYQTNKPVFAVVYGRRRVGKTFLIRELLGDKFAFYHTGLSPYELQGKKLKEQQLSNFYSSLIKYGSDIKRVPTDWLEAFDALISLLEKKDTKKRQVVFIDELPWMDTPRSGFITNNKGGLFDRTTDEIKLRPFTLGECERFYQANHIVMSKFDQVQCYMATGGIPYYISMLQKGKSLAQNIDRLFFEPNAKLKLEFDRLYSSLFTNAEDCKKIVRLLAKKQQGYTRKEIQVLTNLADGGGLSTTLKTLEVSDFITSYIKYDYPKREVYYRLTDFYSKFYLSFIDGKKTTNPSFWQDNLLTPSLTAWRGFTFESLCIYHLPQIKQALGISGVQTESSPWKSRKEKDGAQIDLVIERADHICNICEMKFCEDDFSINASYDKNLRHKLSTFQEETRCKNALHLTLITTYGLKFNEYAGRIQKVITMDDLFRI